MKDSGETVIKTFSTSRWHFIPVYSISLVGSIFTPFSLLLFPLIEVYRSACRYTITNRRLIRSFVLFRKTQESIRYNSITKIDVKQDFHKRLVDIGDIRIRTFGSDDYFTMAGVPFPARVEQLIHSLIEESKEVSEQV